MGGRSLSNRRVRLAIADAAAALAAFCAAGETWGDTGGVGALGGEVAILDCGTAIFDVGVGDCGGDDDGEGGLWSTCRLPEPVTVVCSKASEECSLRLCPHLHIPKVAALTSNTKLEHFTSCSNVSCARTVGAITRGGFCGRTVALTAGTGGGGVGSGGALRVTGGGTGALRDGLGSGGAWRVTEGVTGA